MTDEDRRTVICLPLFLAVLGRGQMVDMTPVH